MAQLIATYAIQINTPSGIGSYQPELRIYLNRQNVATNQSVLGWEFGIRKLRGTGRWSGGTNTWNVNIGGTNVAVGNSKYNFDTVWHDGREPQGAWIVFSSGEHTVTHGTNGTLGTYAFAQWNDEDDNLSDFVIGPTSGSSIVVPTIARATTPVVTPSPVTVGNTITVDLSSRASGSFTHDVTWASGTLSGTIGTGVGTSTTWVVDADVLDEFPGQDPVPVVITVVTKNGGTEVGTRSVTIMARAVPTPVVDGSQEFPFDIRVRTMSWDGTNWKVSSGILPTMTIDLVNPDSGTSTLTFTMSRFVRDIPDFSVVEASIHDGVQWVGVGRFVVARQEDDARQDMSDTVTYGGIDFVDFAIQRGRNQVSDTTDEGPTNKRTFSNSNPGAILHALVTEAKGRGWGPRIQVSFNGSTTSFGDPWLNTVESRDISTGDPISQVLDGLINDGLVEYDTSYSGNNAYLNLYNPGHGRDFTTAEANPVVNLKTAPLQSAPVRQTIESLLTRVTVQGDDNLRTTRERGVPSNVSVIGHLEGWIAAGGVTELDQANRLGDAELNTNGSPVREKTYTYDVSTAPRHLWPYFTFRTRDWILVPGDRDNDPSSPTERWRVSQITIQKTVEGNITASIVVGDRILSATATVARKQSQAAGGAISGGSLRPPITINQLTPAAPQNPTITGQGYWDETGAPRSSVTIEWAAVTQSEAGTALTCDLYEVYWRPDLGSEWKFLTSSDATEVTYAPMDVGQTIEVRVRARSTAGAYGAWSTIAPVNDTSDPFIAPGPSVTFDPVEIDDLYTDGLGTIFVVWNGLIDGVAYPSYFHYVAAEIAPDVSGSPGAFIPAGTPLVAPGVITINPGSYGTWWVRLRAYDRVGTPGDVTAAESITTVAPDTTGVAPLAPENLTVTAYAGWDQEGIRTLDWFFLEWDAVTEDVNGDPANIAGYDVYGERLGGTETLFITSTSSTSATVYVNRGETWNYEVRATSTSGISSDFSTSATGTASASVAAPPTPSTPTLSQYGGILRISWSGTTNTGVPMSNSMRYAYATISTSSGGTYTRAGFPLSGAGETIVTNLAPDTTYYAKITVVDEVGQSSTSAASSGLTLLPITGITYQTSPLADTGIKITSSAMTAYDDSGNPTFIVNANTGEVWIAPYDAVFHFGEPGTEQETGNPTTGLSITSETSSFNTFFHPAGVQIRNGLEALSWWEADAADASLVNFFSPRAVFKDRVRIGDHEFRSEPGHTVIRWVGA